MDPDVLGTLLWSLVLLLVLGAAVVVYLLVRRSLRSSGRESSWEDELTSIEKMASKGGLTPEEMKRVRARMAEKMQKGLAETDDNRKEPDELERLLRDEDRK